MSEMYRWAIRVYKFCYTQSSNNGSFIVIH